MPRRASCLPSSFLPWLFVLAVAFLPSAVVSAQPTLKDVVERGGEGKHVEGAAPSEATPAPAIAPGPVDDMNRGVPRSSVEGFLDATGERDWERAAKYLDVRNVPGVTTDQAPDLARQLAVVIERSLWIDLATLSTRPEGHADDSLPTYRDRVGVIDTAERKVEVLLQRVRRRDGVSIWKISNRTVKEIPSLYDVYGYGPLTERLAEVLPEFRILSLESWQWGGILGLLAICYTIAWAVTASFAWFLHRRGTWIGDRTALFVTGPLRWLVVVLLARESFDWLAPSLAFRALLKAGPLMVGVVAWTILRASDLLFDRLLERLDREQTGSAVFVRPVRTTVHILIFVLAGVILLEAAGFEVTTLMAGLGIGGLAVALAAQKSLEDVFAAITLFSARPVWVGDFCRFRDVVGTVEEIGLRWTRIRTLGHTVVSIPNSEFVKEDLENISQRGKSWYHPRLRLRADTTPDQLRRILGEAEKLLRSHPRVLPDPARIRFAGFGEWSLDLDVFAYIDTRDYGEFLAIAEELNLAITDILAHAGSGLAVPVAGAY